MVRYSIKGSLFGFASQIQMLLIEYLVVHLAVFLIGSAIASDVDRSGTHQGNAFVVYYYSIDEIH